MKKNKIDDELIASLAESLRANNLSELEYEANGVRIKVAVNNYQNKPTENNYLSVSDNQTEVVAKPNQEKEEQSAVESKKQEVVKSPMVGVIYLAPEPSARSYAKVGDTVAKGQTLFLIEAMKTFNYVKAPISGTVAEIFVKDSDLVEYGEPLLALE